jgi:hypothetical protein
MARVDKTDSAIGVVRAPIESDFAEADWDEVIPVGINANGRVVKGAGQTGIIGVVIPGRTVSKAGQIADIFIHADIVEFNGVAGEKYWADADGDIATTEAAGFVYIGFTVEADRLILSGNFPTSAIAA